LVIWWLTVRELRTSEKSIAQLNFQLSYPMSVTLAEDQAGLQTTGKIVSESYWIYTSGEGVG
jgi:hypothetical protein